MADANANERKRPNSVYVKGMPRSHRQSVAVRMENISKDGFIDFEAIEKVVADEVDASKASKYHKKLALVLLGALLTICAANAAMTFMVVQLSKDTGVNASGSLVDAHTHQVVKTQNTDMTVKDGRMTNQETGGDIATAGVVHDMDMIEMFTLAAEKGDGGWQLFQDVESINLSSETGALKHYNIASFEVAEDFSHVTFTTSSGAEIEAHPDGKIFVTDNSSDGGRRRSLLQRRGSFDRRSFGMRASTRFERAPEAKSPKSLIMDPAIARKPELVKTILDFESMGQIKSTAATASYAARITADTKEFKYTGLEFDGNGWKYDSQERRRSLLQRGDEREMDTGGGRERLEEAPEEKIRKKQAAELILSAPLPNPVSASCNANGTVWVAGALRDCTDVDVHAFLSLSTLGVDFLNDVAGWTDSTSGREFAIAGSKDKAVFVEVTDPNNPILVGTMALNGNTNAMGSTVNIWCDVKVWQNYVFIASWRLNSDLVKFDLTNLLTATPGATFGSSNYDTWATSGINGIHNLQVFDNKVYLMLNSPSTGFYACSSGDSGAMILSAYDGSNVGCMASSTVAQSHDLACHTYPQGKKCFVCGGGSNNANVGRITIADVTDMSAISMTPLNNIANSEFVHQNAIHSGGAWMVVTDEMDEYSNTVATMRLKVFAITHNSMTLDNVYVTTHDTIDHQGYFYDDYYFLAAYQSGVFMHSFDTATGALAEVGHLDTAPLAGADFTGAWSVHAFPYNRCGNTYYKTVVSDTGGLWIVQPRLQTGNSMCSSYTFNFALSSQMKMD